MEEQTAGGGLAVSRAIVAIALIGLGILSDAVLHSSNPGLGIFVTACAGVALLCWATRPGRASTGFLAAGVAASAFTAIRTNVPLLPLDLLAGLMLGILGASFARGGVATMTGIRSYVLRGFRLIRTIPAALGLFVPPAGALGESLPVARIVRPLVIAGGAATVFGLVLSSADPVFAHVVTAPFRVSYPLENIVQHGLTIGFAIAAAAMVVVYATKVQTAGSLELPIYAGFSLRPADWKVMLVAVDGMFGLFVAIQFAYLFGGAGRIVESTGLTYAQYARTGFGQMVLAALLALALIGIVWVAGARDAGAPTSFRILSGVLIGLAGVVLVSAFQRLSLYESTFGWTETRLFGHAIIIWLAAFLVCCLIAVVIARGTWLAFASIALAVATLCVLNVMNADRFIAERNIERYRDTGKIDASYLTRLSNDAVPAIVAALPALPAGSRAIVEKNLACRKWVLDQPRGFFASNWGMSQAQKALDASAIPPNPVAGRAGCDASS